MKIEVELLFSKCQKSLQICFSRLCAVKLNLLVKLFPSKTKASGMLPPRSAFPTLTFAAADDVQKRALRFESFPIQQQESEINLLSCEAGYV